MLYLGKYKVLNHQIFACDNEFIAEKIRKKRRDLLICPITTYTLVMSVLNKKFQKILNNVEYLLPDSQWVKKSMNFLYKIKMEKRVYGPDLMLYLCGKAQQTKMKVAFYGSTKSILNKLNRRIHYLYPKLRLSMNFPVNYDQLDNDLNKIVKLLTKEKIDILFVGLGSLKQEEFGVKLLELKKTNYPLAIITVGAAFDFISDTKKQSPIFLSEAGFEWFYRLLQEPRRLWKRYLIYGFIFLGLIGLQKLHLVYKSRYK